MRNLIDVMRLLTTSPPNKEEFVELCLEAADCIEKTQPQDGGWINWLGGERPIDPTANYEVILRCGDHCKGRVDPPWDWHHDGGWSDIMKYRIVEE